MKEKTPLSVKLETELSTRLDECSKRTKIKKYSLALMAIEAAIEAIEKNDYRLVVPIEFAVARIPAPAVFPPARETQMLSEEGKAGYRVTPPEEGATGNPAVDAASRDILRRSVAANKKRNSQ